MSTVFWFTGRMRSGKTTLARKLEVYLKNKENVSVIDGDEFRTLPRNYRFLRWRKIKMSFFKKIVKQSELFLQKNSIVLIAETGSPHASDYAKKKWGERYTEIYLKCSMECSLQRQQKNRILKNILKMTSNYYAFFDEPKSPDIIIDTENQSIEESFQTLLQFIKKKLN